MSPDNSLKENFYDLLSRDISILEWITKDTLYGIWVVNKDFPRNFWANDAFLKNSGFTSVAALIADLNSLLFSSELERIQKIVQDSSDEISDVKLSFNFQKDYRGEIELQAHVQKVVGTNGEWLYIFKFSRIDTDENNVDFLLDTLDKAKNKLSIYHETNKIAEVGGWEVDLVNNKLSWTRITKAIHEVDADYEPDISSGLNFYKPGRSRDKITKLFDNAITKGVPFDTKLKLITAKNREIWVRSLGKPEFKNGKCVRVYGAFQNIDREKRIQLEFERTKEQYEMIFNNSAIGNVLVHSSGKLLEVNPATLKIFGFEQEDMETAMSLTFKDLIHKDFLQAAVKQRKMLVSGEVDSYQLESKFYKKDGSLIWCRTNSSIIRSLEDNGDLIITQIEDINDTKELEVKASENSKRFKAAFEYSPNGMGVVSLEGNWQMVNQNLASMFGFSKEEFKEKSFKELTHEDDFKKDTALLGSLLNREIETYSVEKRFIHKSGRTIFGLLNVSTILGENGQPLYLIGQISDITKRIVSERALQKSLNELQCLMDATSQIAIIQTDLKGKVEKFNKGAENLLGYKEEEIKYTFNATGFHDEEEIESRALTLSDKYNKNISGFEIFSYPAQRGDYNAREWTYIRKDGSRFTVQLIVTSITNHRGKITGFLGVATDISQLKEMEVSLINAKIKAEAASKSKSEFLANMSHEIRTPLNGIIGFTDLLMRTELENSQQKYMHTVYNSANSLMDIINDVLDFSKIEAGKLELSVERTDLIELCDQTVDIIKHQAHKKGLEVLMNISPSLRRYVYADAVRLRQILTNLLGNSVKFTQKGEIELSISSETVEGSENDRILTFSIRDTGIGIAPQNLKKIFHAFDQEDASTTRKYGGSGLGLSISNKLLNLMDSKLELRSVLNEGSEFYFKVRLRTDKEVNYISRPSKNVKNVLVIDDNTNNRIILKDMLAANNIDSQECANGVEALNILKKGEQNFDLAIVDFNMPYMNGISVIDQIRNNLKLTSNDLPVILLHSSTEDDEILKGCKRLDVRFNIPKPIQIHTLYKMIDEIEELGVAPQAAPRDLKFTMDSSKVYNILIVEDNPVNKFLAKTIIKKVLPNANLLEAENGEDAVTIFQQFNLDLIFMDIQMPVMGGIEATREIRKVEKENSYTPIVALTARTVKNEEELCLESGMDDYLTKPVVMEDMRLMMVKHLKTD